MKLCDALLACTVAVVGLSGCGGGSDDPIDRYTGSWVLTLTGYSAVSTCPISLTKLNATTASFSTTCSVNASTFSMTGQVGADGKTLGGNLWSGSFSESSGSGNFMAMSEMFNGKWTAKRP